jgi:uncharacterized protein (DUF58 family)
MYQSAPLPSTDRARRLLRFGLMARTVWLTPFAVGVIFMAVLLTGAAVNTGTSLIYVMLALLVAFFTLSFVLGFLNLNGLSISRVPPRECYAFEPAEFQVALRNRKRWLPSFGISVEERIEGGQPESLSAYFLAAPARRATVTPAKVAFTRRGIVRLEGVRVGTIFPFGLLAFQARRLDPMEILVFPRMHAITDPPRRLSRGAGEKERAEKGHAAGLHSIREYVHGDPARDIHWRLSAKGAGVKIREYEAESAEGIQLVLDARKGEAGGEREREHFERAISLTASLARHYLNEGIEVMLWTPAGVVPRGAGPAHLKRILRSLALVEIDDLNPHASPPSRVEDMTQVWIAGPGAAPAGERDGRQWAAYPTLATAAPAPDAAPPRRA